MGKPHVCEQQHLLLLRDLKQSGLLMAKIVNYLMLLKEFLHNGCRRPLHLVKALHVDDSHAEKEYM